MKNVIFFFYLLQYDFFSFSVKHKIISNIQPVCSWKVDGDLLKIMSKEKKK